MAELVDTSRTTIYNIEYGKKSLGFELLVKLAQQLDVPLDYLVYGRKANVNEEIATASEDLSIDKRTELEKLIIEIIKYFKSVR